MQNLIITPLVFACKLPMDIRIMRVIYLMFSTVNGVQYLRCTLWRRRHCAGSFHCPSLRVDKLWYPFPCHCTARCPTKSVRYRHRSGYQWTGHRICTQSRHDFTLGQGAILPNLSLAPPNLLTAAVCSSKTSKQLYRKRFWRVGVVDLVVLACVLRRRLKKVVNFCLASPNIFF